MAEAVLMSRLLGTLPFPALHDMQNSKHTHAHYHTHIHTHTHTTHTHTHTHTHTEDAIKMLCA